MNDSTQGKPMSRRERLKREREERILDAAATIIARKGFHEATIHEIAELADVADGTIYNYFASKPDLLIGLLSRLIELEQMPGELLQALQYEARDFFVLTFRHRMGRILQGEEILKALLPQVIVDQDLRARFYQQYVQRIARLLEQYVQSQVERGRIRPINVPLMVRLVQGAFVGLLLLRILGDELLYANWDEVPEALAMLLFDGLSSKEGG